MRLCPHTTAAHTRMTHGDEYRAISLSTENFHYVTQTIPSKLQAQSKNLHTARVDIIRKLLWLIIVICPYIVKNVDIFKSQCNLQ